MNNGDWDTVFANLVDAFKKIGFDFAKFFNDCTEFIQHENGGQAITDLDVDEISQMASAQAILTTFEVRGHIRPSRSALPLKLT